MPNVKVLNMQGAAVGEIALADDVFGVEAHVSAKHTWCAPFSTPSGRAPSLPAPARKCAAATARSTARRAPATRGITWPPGA